MLAPEVILMWAFSQWEKSSAELKKKLGADPTCGWTETHAMLAQMGGLQVFGEDGTRVIETSLSKVPSGAKMPTKGEIMDRSKRNWLVMAITFFQALSFVVQAANRASQDLTVTALEFITLAHIALSILVYWCWWNKPMNVRFPLNAYLQGTQSTWNEKREKKHPQSDSESQVTAPLPKLPVRVRMGVYFNHHKPGLDKPMVTTMIPIFCFAIVGGLFGAISCLAWNSSFPTHIEQMLWRISAVVVTLAPGAVFFIFALGGKNAPQVASPAIFAYRAGRICLLLLALTAFRSLSYSAYGSPSWSIYVPHIGW